MKKLLNALLLLTATISSLTAQIVYEGGEGPGKGKHIVFVVSDHEYRSEQGCPALARILAKHHGFKCTVLFGIDKDGNIEGGSSNIPGIEVLKEADCMFLFARFLDPTDEWMGIFEDYLERGGPIVSCRTSTHPFKIEEGKKYSRFDRRYKRKEGDPFKNGFGEQIIGNTFVGHFGKNHKQGVRLTTIPEQKEHPILRGVGSPMFAYAGGYNGVIREGMTALTMTKPLMTMYPDGAGSPGLKAVPSSWTREYSYEGGPKGKVFHSTQGAAQDFLDANYRRLMINGVYWTLGMEGQIKADSNVSIVGSYEPTKFGMKQWLSVKPETYAGFESTIGDPELAAYERGEWHSPNGGIQRYRLRAPKVVSKGTKYPLFIYLHGKDGCGHDNTSQIKADEAGKVFEQAGIYEKAYFFAPQLSRLDPKNKHELRIALHGWVDTDPEGKSHTMPKEIIEMRLMFEKVEALLADPKCQIDPSRIYIGGIGIGGYGVWDAIQRRPDFFAAAIPVNGGGDTQLAEKIGKLPIWAWHAEGDKKILTSRSTDMIEAIKKAGGSPKYTAGKTRRDIFKDAFSNKELWTWLLEQKRKL